VIFEKIQGKKTILPTLDQWIRKHPTVKSGLIRTTVPVTPDR